jgi:hypothetical protein
MVDQATNRQAGRLASRIQQLVALTLLFAGIVWIALGPTPADEVEAFIGPTLIVVGVCWFVGARVLSWWVHHR